MPPPSRSSRTPRGPANNWGNALSDQASPSRAWRRTGCSATRAKYCRRPQDQAGQARGLEQLGQRSPIRPGPSRAWRRTGCSATRARNAAALKIKPDKHEALNNWGNALSGQARTKSGVEADRLFGDAGEKYAAALKIKPDLHEALNNWGNALSDQAKAKSGVEADRLFGAASEMPPPSRSRPDFHEALNNWGNALLVQATTKSGPRPLGSWREAQQRLERALAGQGRVQSRLRRRPAGQGAGGSRLSEPMCRASDSADEGASRSRPGPRQPAARAVVRDNSPRGGRSIR
ncbi:MAG: hypothetical protein U1E21_01340 [Reyranellaceae bacterium]